MARARLPHCCDKDDDEDAVSREIGFDLTDAGIQEHKVSGFNSDCFIFKLSCCSYFGSYDNKHKQYKCTVDSKNIS